MFERATKAVIEVGESVIDSAKSLGNSIYASSKEQGEIAGMKVQKSVIESRLKDVYAQIGKEYVQYVENAEAEKPFDVSELLESMKPDLEKLAEIEQSLAAYEAKLKEEAAEQRLKKAQNEFDAAKAKLDRALSMDIITQEEYEEKLAAAQKKFDNYEQLRKIEMQLSMEIITREEYQEKLDKLLK